jgi:hyperosmotically inducible periplasmic protein
MQRRTWYIGLIVCLVGLMAVLGCAGDRTSRSTGQAVDDSVLANKVKMALYSDKVAPGTQIDVEVFKGVVQLSGFVDSPEQAQKAVQIARGIDGVKEVRNGLIVK